MPLLNYGLLTGRLVNHTSQSGENPHHLLVVQVGTVRYTIAINLAPTLVGSRQAKLQYLILNDLRRSTPAAKRVAARVRRAAALVPEGSFLLREQTVHLPTLDYVRDGVVKLSDFTTLSRAARTNAFERRLVRAANQAVQDSRAFVAAFGTGHPDQDDRKTGFAGNPSRASFGFTGVDNTHMNQGSSYLIGNHLTGHFAENGPNQDGAVLFFFEDGQVEGFFTKFTSQDASTDQFGNPLRTSVPVLDAVPTRVKTRAAKTAPTALFPSLLRKVDQSRDAAVAAETTSATDATSAVNPDGFVFSDTVPSDPTRPFKPDQDSSDIMNSPFVQQFAKHGVPEPVPGPREGVNPVMTLDTVLGASTISTIKNSGQIVFHVVGDTGAPKVNKLPNEVAVADLMVKDFDQPRAQRPVFFFHLGDVVYYYGEDAYYYDQFYKPYEFYPAPIFAIPGNHDGITYRSDMVSLNAFIKSFCTARPRHDQAAAGISRTTMTQPGVYFTLDAPFVSIIGLYSNCSESYGYLDQQQKLFLYKELMRLKPLRDRGDVAAVLIAVHHPPLSFSPTKPSSARMRDDMDQACAEAGLWPDAVFSGHAHVYQRMTRTLTATGVKGNVLPYVICGAGGYDANAKQEVNKQDMGLEDTSDPHFRLHRFLATYGYLRITVTPAGSRQAGTLRVEFHSPDTGQSSDVFTLDLSTHQLL